MSNILKNRSVTRYYIFAGLAVLYGVWHVLSGINQELDALPIKSMPAPPRHEVPSDTRQFYPVWIRQPAQRNSAAETKVGEVDGLFHVKSPQPTSPTSAAILPDKLDSFAQRASLEGIADNGAYINGQFYRLGEEIDDSSTGGHMNGEFPVLVSVGSNEVTVAVERKTIVLKLATRQ